MSLVSLIVALATSAAATFALVTLLPRVGLVDRPNARSSHDRPVPRGGGLAVLLGVALGVLTAGVPSGLAAATVLAALAGVLGLADDRSDLPVRVRLLAQVVLAGLAATQLLFTSSLGVVSVVGLALLWVAFVNAFNFMDGINGISALIVIVSSLWFVHVGPEPVQVLGWVVAAAATGFLLFNAAGKVFLGDVGSYSLGSLLWSMTALSLASGADAVDSLAPMSLYGLETAVAVAMLMRAGGRPGQPHRLHAYQQLVDRGLTHMRVALIAASVLGAMLLALGVIPQTWLAVTLALLLAVAYIASPRVLERAGDKSTASDNMGR